MTTSDSPHPQQAFRTDRQRLLLSGLVIVAAVASLYSAIAVYSRIDRLIAPSRQFSGLSGPTISLGPLEVEVAPPLPFIEKNDTYSPKDRINILVLGLDRRPEEGEACTRADTFFIVSFDSFHNTASVLSFPRDTYLKIPDGNGGTYPQRINTTTVFGCLYDYPGGGPALARDTLKLNFGIDVENYVVLDFVGFQQLIDSMGGIDVDVPEAIGVNSIQFAAGPQHMDGARALQYSRLRPDGDFKRIERQQLVMVTVAKKALGLGLLNNPLGTYEEFQDTVDTDIATAKLPGLGLLAKDIGLDEVKTYSLACYKPTEGAPCQNALTSFTTPEGASVQLPIWPLTFSIINQAMPDPGILGDAATVGIVGQDPAVVALVKEYLVQKGIAPDHIATDGVITADLASRRILDVTDKNYTAHRIGEWLGIDDGEVTSAQPGQASGADVVIVLGDDYALPDGAVVVE